MILVGFAIPTIAQTPINTLSPVLEQTPSEDSQLLDIRTQKEIELIAKSSDNNIKAKDFNFGYLKANGFSTLNKLMNPRLAATLRKPNLIKLLSPMPIVVDEKLNPLNLSDEYQSLFQNRFESIRNSEAYLDLLGQYIYIPELKGGLWSVRPEQILVSKVLNVTQHIYTETDPTFDSWVNLQIELGNYCIMHASGVPSLLNIPVLKKEDEADQVLLELRAKAFSSLVKRWYFFYTTNAKSILPALIPQWDKITNSDELFDAIQNLQISLKTNGTEP